MLKSLLPNDVKINITIDDIRLKSNLTTNETFRFTEKSFFYTTLGFTQSHLGPLGDNKGFVLVEKFQEPIEAIGPLILLETKKIHLRCDCINGSIVNGCSEPILFNFALDMPPGHEI